MAVVKLMNYKCLFAMGVQRGYYIYYIDVIMGFLYGFFNEVIYVEQFYLFVIEPGIVCKLIKILYGSKQVPHIWYKTLIKFHKKLGFIQLEFDFKGFYVNG